MVWCCWCCCNMYEVIDLVVICNDVVLLMLLLYRIKHDTSARVIFGVWNCSIDRKELLWNCSYCCSCCLFVVVIYLIMNYLSINGSGLNYMLSLIWYVMCLLCWHCHELDVKHPIHSTSSNAIFREREWINVPFHPLWSMRLSN